MISYRDAVKALFISNLCTYARRLSVYKFTTHNIPM